MQCSNLSLPSRLHRGRVLTAAALTASALLLATAPQAMAQDGVWEHYDVADPKVIELDFETDLFAFDLCWSEHTAMAKEQIVNGAVAQMNDPTQLHVIRLPDLPPFYRRMSNAPVWRDMTGEVIRSSDVLPNRPHYHIHVEQALVEVVNEIRTQRPGAKIAFEGFELQPLPGRPPAYAELGALQDFYVTDRTIYLNHVGHMLRNALNSTFYRARVDFSGAQDNWLVFPNQTGDFSMASVDNPEWPPEEIEPEILALWGGGGDDDGGDGGGGGDGADVVGGIPVLNPGTGWVGATAQPNGYGLPAELGWDAKPIARWNVVPFQDVDATFQLGVVAFHMNGIDRVEFSVDDGPWETVHTAEYNPRTETEEYSVILEPALFAGDGKVEIRAIVYPDGAGVPRVLAGPVEYAGSSSGWYGPELDSDGQPTNSLWIGEHSLELFVNAGGTLAEQTIELDGGQYVWGQPPLAHPMSGDLQGAGLTQHDDERWVVVRAKPGVDPSESRIVDAVTSRPYSAGDGSWTVNYSKVKLEGLTIEVADPDDPDSTDGRPTYMTRAALWLDNCHVSGPGQLKSAGGFTISHGFFTNSQFTDLRSATGHHGGYGSGHFVRGCSFERIGEKAIRAGYLVINTTADTINPGDTSWHSSVISNPLRHDNRIYQNLDFSNVDAKAIAFRSENWNLNGHRDVALSGVRVNGDPTGTSLMFLGGDVRNMVLRDCTFDASSIERAWAYRLSLPPSDPRYFRPHTLVFDSVTWNGSHTNVPAPYPMEGIYFLD